MTIITLMGVVIRSPTSRKIEKDDCRCFTLEKNNFLCFRKNFTGALTDEQEQKYCTPKSFLSEKSGGFAKDVDSEESKSILRTIGMFTKGVKVAKKEYEESGQRSIPYWQNVVKHKVDEVYLHPLKTEVQKSEKADSKPEVREEFTKSPVKAQAERHFSPEAQRKWDIAVAKRQAHEAKRMAERQSEPEIPDERKFITPEQVRALTEVHQRKFEPVVKQAISNIMSPLSDYRYDKAEQVASRLDYRYNRFED